MLRFAFLALAALFVTPLFDATAQSKDIPFNGIACPAVYPCSAAPDFNVDPSLFGFDTLEGNVCFDRAKLLCDNAQLKIQRDKAARKGRAQKSRDRKNKGRRN